MRLTLTPRCCIQLPPVPEAEAEDAAYATDDDPLDDMSVDALGIGIVVRTDFSNEEAWQAFCSKLRAAEAEFSTVSDDAMDAETHAADAAVPGESSSKDDDAQMDDDAPEDGEADDEAEPTSIFSVLNPDDVAQRRALEHISNLTALRLLNDVDIRPAPPLPAGEKRVKPPNRLVDCDGWQETYAGKILWVYDSKSNADQCVRLISQQSAMYGTATCVTLCLTSFARHAYDRHMQRGQLAREGQPHLRAAGEPCVRCDDHRFWRYGSLGLP
jgi:hypothetical protein